MDYSKVYEFCMDFHNGMVIEYQSVFVHLEDRNKMSVCRSDDGVIKSAQGICNIDLEKSVLSFMYDALFISAPIIEYKKNGDNWKFRCATGSLKFDLYIIDVDMWSDDVDAIF